jgi:predicted ATPase/class 3 adenylate cyclase
MLPSGEVTFVFTDIEGSTRMLRALGDRYAPMLARHRDLLRAAAAAQGGVEVDNEGDALFIAFADAARALRAALTAQQLLAAEPWSDGTTVRVRIGVHTGEAAPVAGGGYVSLAVHQAARIAAAGHGGQIIFSDATLSAAEDVTFGVLRDLGQHYLKDFDDPVRLWQLTAPGTPAEFPPLRTGDVRLPFADAAPAGMAGLPTQWTTFVGRERETRDARKALSEGRLVTLLGPGGVGKTRLAAEVATAASVGYEHGGAFVELVPVRPEFVVQAVAAALGVTGRAGQTLDESVLEYLATRTALLVLDNCEHVLEAVAELVGRILAGCPRITVLTTSRERLGVPGERLITVPPLATATTEADAMPSEATLLFLDRAQAADPDFADDPATVAELCARLDGMPLAIELAAARAGSLGATELLAGLGDQLRLLAGGRSADERHRSLRSVLDWSYSLLGDEERGFLRRLGVFAGGFDLGAAADVAIAGERAAAADLLGRLADKSLIVRQRGVGSARWRLLETVRTYALDNLAASDDAATTRTRHLQWAAGAARHLEQRLDTDPGWRDEFDVVADDLRAAIATDTDAETVYALAMATAKIVFAHRFYEEAQAHFERAADVARNTAAAMTAVRAAAEVCQANVHTGEGFELLLRAADLAAAAGDTGSRAACLAQAIVVANRFPAGLREYVPPARLSELLELAQRVAPPDDAHVQAYLVQAAAWHFSAESKVLSVDPQRAAEALAAARAVHDPVLISGALDAVLAGVLASGRMREGFALAKERMTNLNQLSRNDPRAAIELTDTYHMLNEQSLAAGELPTALREMRTVQHDDVSVFVGFNASSKLVGSLVLTGALAEALEHADEMWTGWLAAGSPTARWMSPAVAAAALAAGLRGDDAVADEWLRRTQRVVGDEDMFTHRNSAAMASFAVARRAMHAGRHAEAVARTQAFGANAGAWYAEDARWYYDAYVWALDAELAVLAASSDAPARLAAAQPAADENRWAAACLDRAWARLTGDAAPVQRSVQRWEAIDARFERACTLLLLPDRADEGLAELDAIGATYPR